MKIMASGINYSTKKLLIDSLDEQVFAKTILNSLDQNVAEIRRLAGVTTRGTTFRDARELQRKIVDYGDPHSVGWTFLLSKGEPHRQEIVDAIRPLAEHRGMKNPDKPLLFQAAEDEWLDWLQEDYFSPDLEQPHYILIVGGPDRVPFHFQSVLGTAAAVGRVDFDSIDDLKVYVSKVVELERARNAIVSAETVFFAPDYGLGDPTYFSRRFMAEPLAANVSKQTMLKTHNLFGREATKSRFLELLLKTKPALIYTASHGLGAPEEPFETQKRMNGAICCMQSEQDWLFAADDIPANEPFLEGAVFFQFACFGYGTPAESDYAHWLGKPELNTESDFVAALPKKLLAHPRGPISYVGHVDTAWLHGFDDPDAPGLSDVWNPRIQPFKTAVELLLGVEPLGQAMVDMSKRFDLYNAALTNIYDRMQRGRYEITPASQATLVNRFLTRSDAQNYMIFGDPAARLRIPEG